MSDKDGTNGSAVHYKTNGSHSLSGIDNDDISVSDASDVTDVRFQKRASKSNGPWSNSSQNYSRTVDKPESEHEPLRSSSSRLYMCFCVIAVVVFLVGLGLGIVIGNFAIHEKKVSTNDHLPPGQQVTDYMTTTTTTAQHTLPSCSCQTSPGTCLICESRDPDISTGNEATQSVFAPVTRDEISKVVQLLRARNLISTGSNIFDNRLSHVYLNLTNKTEALGYLDDGGPFPGRYARVHVIRGIQDDMMEYKIGPLHEEHENMTVIQLIADGQININRRPYDTVEMRLLRQMVLKEFTKLNPIFSDSFNGATLQRGVYFSVVSFPSTDVTLRVSSAFLYLQTNDAYTLRLLPVTCILRHPGVMQSNWVVSDFYYLSQGPFSTAEDLLDAYNSNNIRKFKLPANYAQQMSTFDLNIDDSLPRRIGSNIPPPQTFSPKGPRYVIKGNRVSWLGWEFEFASDPQRGPGIYDVRFKGQRIAYEISLQDVTLIYASQSNGAGPPVLTDIHFQLGRYSRPRTGIDCPKRASYISSTAFFYGDTRTTDGTCVFETNSEIPIWRHKSRGLADHYLVIRSPMDLGNYDYSLQWAFHLDGSIETQISASGYLYGSFWDPNDPLVNEFKSSTPFGYRLSDFLLGPIHDHSYSFKVDLDILGTQNSLETLHWKGGSPLEALRTQTNVNAAPGHFYLNTTRYIQYELLNTENGFSVDPSNPKYWTVVNENERNFWGVKRGYRIIPRSTSAEHLSDHVMFTAWGHLKHNIAVTKRKETEPYATDSLYDLSQPGESFRGVGKMLDNENVRNEDLVLWVTEKFLHAPSSEDVPITLQIHKGFTLKPYNYFDRTPTFDVPGHYTMNEPYDIEPCIENV